MIKVMILNKRQMIEKNIQTAHRIHQIGRMLELAGIRNFVK